VLHFDEPLLHADDLSALLCEVSHELVLNMRWCHLDLQRAIKVAESSDVSIAPHWIVEVHCVKLVDDADTRKLWVRPYNRHPMSTQHNDTEIKRLLNSQKLLQLG
jgi:hypothetical protein